MLGPNIIKRILKSGRENKTRKLEKGQHEKDSA